MISGMVSYLLNDSGYIMNSEKDKFCLSLVYDSKKDMAYLSLEDHEFIKKVFLAPPKKFFPMQQDGAVIYQDCTEMRKDLKDEMQNCLSCSWEIGKGKAYIFHILVDIERRRAEKKQIIYNKNAKIPKFIDRNMYRGYILCDALGLYTGHIDNRVIRDRKNCGISRFFEIERQEGRDACNASISGIKALISQSHNCKTWAMSVIEAVKLDLPDNLKQALSAPFADEESEKKDTGIRGQV